MVFINIAHIREAIDIAAEKAKKLADL